MSSEPAGDGRPLSFPPRGSPVEWCLSDRAVRALSVAALLFTVIALASTPHGAQRQQEFTQQGLLIAPFKSADRKLGNKVADEIRGRVEKAGSKRDLEVIDEKSMVTA